MDNDSRHNNMEHGAETVYGTHEDNNMVMSEKVIIFCFVIVGDHRAYYIGTSYLYMIHTKLINIFGVITILFLFSRKYTMST